MRLRTWLAAAACGAFILALASLGCTGNTTLPSSHGQASVTVSSNPTATATYGWATFGIPQIKFDPVNPIADSVIGPLGFLRGTLTVSLNNSAETVVASVPLTAQSYRIEPFTISTFQLNTATVPPVVSSCDNGVLVTLRIESPVTVDPGCVFNVPPAGSVTFGIQVDGAGMADLLASKYDCASNTFTPPTDVELLQEITFRCGP